MFDKFQILFIEKLHSWKKLRRIKHLVGTYKNLQFINIDKTSPTSITLETKLKYCSRKCVTTTKIIGTAIMLHN